MSGETQDGHRLAGATIAGCSDLPGTAVRPGPSAAQGRLVASAVFLRCLGRGAATLGGRPAAIDGGAGGQFGRIAGYLNIRQPVFRWPSRNFAGSEESTLHDTLA